MQWNWGEHPTAAADLPKKSRKLNVASWQHNLVAADIPSAERGISLIEGRLGFRGKFLRWARGLKKTQWINRTTNQTALVATYSFNDPQNWQSPKQKPTSRDMRSLLNTERGTIEVPLSGVLFYVLPLEGARHTAYAFCLIEIRFYRRKALDSCRRRWIE